MKKESFDHFPNAAFDVVAMAASAGGLTALSQKTPCTPIVAADQERQGAILMMEEMETA